MAPLYITSSDPHYPPALRTAHPPPEQLYYEGKSEILLTNSISIVGSRNMTAYGAAVLKYFIPSLVRAGLTVISGLAYGIDAEAHRLTLAERGRCVAVLGSGLNRVYPTQHAALYKAILENGCVITEYPPDTEAKPYHFPARNRIVAALSPVVLIIEAGEKSGTLSTARHAHDSGRSICVVPGDITREQSRGVNQLLKEGAIPVVSPEDILAQYQLTLPIIAESPLQPALTGSPRFLYDCISRGVSSIEALLIETQWEITRLYSTLSILEIDGYIVCKQQEWLKIS